MPTAREGSLVPVATSLALFSGFLNQTLSALSPAMICKVFNSIELRLANCSNSTCGRHLLFLFYLVGGRRCAALLQLLTLSMLADRFSQDPWSHRCRKSVSTGLQYSRSSCPLVQYSPSSCPLVVAVVICLFDGRVRKEASETGGASAFSSSSRYTNHRTSSELFLATHAEERHLR